MTDLLLFLGAGASKPFGIPTMREVVGDAAHVVKQEDREAATVVASTVEILRLLYGGASDLERLLTVLHDLASGRGTEALLQSQPPDVAYRVHRLLSGPGSIREALEELDKHLGREKEAAANAERILITRLVEECSGGDKLAAVSAYHSLLTSLAGRVIHDAQNALLPSNEFPARTGERVRPAAVVTTNYDQCFESYCTRYGIPWSTGFSSSVRDPDSEFVDAPRGDSVPFPILKLHGSVDWWRTTGNRVLWRQRGTPGQELMAGDRLTAPEIRYPISEKELFGDPYLRLYARFADFLAQHKLWVFIGYSFGDPSVCQLVSEAVRPATRVILLHPHADEIARSKLGSVSGNNLITVQARFPGPQLLEAIGRR